MATAQPLPSFAAPDSLSLTGRRWRQASQRLDHAGGSWLDPLLTARGVAAGVGRERFFAPSLAHMADPQALADMDRAVARVLVARQKSEPICIYGDYDVDGVCSTALLMDFLGEVGLSPSFYIPDRRGEGYGLNEAAIASLSGAGGVLITVDCGSTSHKELALARASGLDVIVLDHHQLAQTLPEAVAVVNPHRTDCTFGERTLCAAGVAFMFACALRRALRQIGAFSNTAEPDVRRLLDLAALATVADLVPLTGLNRVLVSRGLQRLRQAPRPGLEALCQVAGVDRQQLRASDLGFRLGPRVNARGRMSHAGLAVELMLAPDVASALGMAKTLDEANQQRRETEQQTVACAMAEVDKLGLGNDAMLVVADPHWHPGVLGLVASRLVSTYHRPALVIGEGGRGSARSVAGIDLHAALTRAQQHLLRLGGHPMAAGVTADFAAVPQLRHSLAEDVSRTLGAPPYAPWLAPELELAPAAGPGLWHELYDALERMAPFGQGNAEPLLCASEQTVHAHRVVGTDHLKLTLGPDRLDAIAFGQAKLAQSLPQRLDILAHLERNSFRGTTRLQLRVVDMRPSQPA